MQCQCNGVIVANKCNKCAHIENSEWKFGSCRCKPGYNLFGNECLKNHAGNDSPDSCNVGTFYDSQQKRCLSCPQGCLTCENSYECLQCNPDFSYDYNSKLCTEHCGDGKKYIL